MSVLLALYRFLGRSHVKAGILIASLVLCTGGFLATPCQLCASTIRPADLASGNSQAGTHSGDGAAITFTSSPNNFTNGTWSLGWEFTTSAPINVTALGFYNATLNGGSSGLNAGCMCGEVGIYNATGTLLVSAIVTNSDPALSFFNYASISPIALSAGGTYYVAAETGLADYTFYTTGFSVNPGIDFVQDAYFFSSTLAFPAYSVGITAADGGGFFGPNFKVNVSEPSTLTLLSVLMGLALFSWSLCSAFRVLKRFGNGRS
jgi:hypothetical protein